MYPMQKHGALFSCILLLRLKENFCEEFDANLVLNQAGDGWNKLSVRLYTKNLTCEGKASGSLHNSTLNLPYLL